MSTNGEACSDENMLSESHSSPPKVHTVRLYCVRLYCVRVHDPKDGIKLKADFGNKILLTFNVQEQLSSTDNFVPFIYTLDLNMKLDNMHQLCVVQKNVLERTDDYHLIISRPRLLTVRPKIHHQEKASQKHQLPHDFGNPHHFLFDIQFSKSNAMEPPGIGTNCFEDLCFFTYFLLRNQRHCLFDVLAHQFKANLDNDNRTFDKNNYNDFFERCHSYIDEMLSDLQTNHRTLIILVRMIGLLPIEKESFSRYNRFANEFATKIMLHVREQFNHLLQSVSENEQLLFRSGLATLVCIELLYPTSDDSNDNKFSFLSQVSNKIQRQDIANEILLQLYKLNLPIYANSTWTDLFTIVHPDMVRLQESYLTASLETYIILITKASKVYPDKEHFNSKITKEFERLINLKIFQIDLKTILFLITFVKCERTYDHEATQRLINKIQSIVARDLPLKHTIYHYFDKLNVIIESLENIRYILCSRRTCTFLEMVKKYDFLEKSLMGDNTDEYYIKWFQCFLANAELHYDDDEKKRRKVLLEAWINCFKSDYSKFTAILIAIDQLLNAFEESADDNWFRSYFIDQTVHLCFQQKCIFHVIGNGLLHVQNESFRIRFRDEFDNKRLDFQQQNLLRKIGDNKNPLDKLIELDKQVNSQSMLVCDLIQFICDKIELIKDDLMHDTFNQPTRTNFTYIILFQDYFVPLPIHIKVIQALIPIWEEWENDGFEGAQLQTWGRLKKEQRQVAIDIWDLIGKNTGKTISFEELIDVANRQRQTIVKINDNVRLCINNYCQYATDKKFYSKHLEDIEKQLDHEKVQSVQVSKDIKKLQTFADRLNPIFESSTWKKFLEQHKTDVIESNKINQDAIINTTEISLRTQETDNNTTNKIPKAQSKVSINYDMYQEKTCITILNNVIKILNLFIDRLKFLCTEKNQPFLSQLEHLFPAKCLIDHEFKIFKHFIDENTVSYLELLLEYWKTREHIIHICRGCINLLTKENTPSSDKIAILQNVLDLDEHTSGETFIAVYQEYRTHYSKVYSESILSLIGQMNSSHELLEFLYSLTASDVDDLLEVVNDWDETLINTKTVLEFVLLKRFFDEVDAMIGKEPTERPLGLEDTTKCFQNVLEITEFENILSSFAFCSSSLFSIKRIHMELTSKQQSKRKRILDIMKNSHYCFCVHPLKETVTGIGYQFDVHIMNNDWEPTSFDDLNELRDRARLIQYANNTSSKLQNYTDDYIKQLQSFVLFVETIETILQSLTSLNIAGYPILKQFPISNRKFTCSESNFNELNGFKLKLEAQLVDWEDQLCTMYENCIGLTYFSYQQVWVVERSLYNQTATVPDDQGYHLLKFIGIDSQLIRPELLPSRSEKLNDRLKNMALILNIQRVNRHSAIQADGRTTKKVFLIETSNKGILRAIYSLFDFNSAQITANKLFYCTINTNWIEIRAFIYRCFFSQTLHQLIRPELLSLLIQDKFAQLFNQLIEQYPKHFFHLGLITTVSSAHLHIVNGLKTRRIVQVIHDQDMLAETALENMILPHIGDTCMLVTSRIAGLGKSTYIRNEMLRLNKKYVKFPISGDMDIDSLTKRLCNKEIQHTSSTIAIHIDIGPVENVQHLNEFLYCLVLFRCFRLRQVPVHIPADIPIYIELDSSSYLVNLKDEIVVFKYLQTKHLDRMNWDELEVNNSSAIQLVTNYLRAVEDQTIITKDINEGIITALDKPICIRLLKNYFLPRKNDKFVSWTQLSIFIAIYYRLLSDFSKCAHFLVNPEYHSSIRIDILNILLQSSDQFTSLSVDAVRQNQRSTNDADDESILPFSEAIIRWDKSQPFTVIFTATYDPLFVYKTLNDVPTSLNDAFHFYFKLLNDKRIVKNVPQRSFFSFWSKPPLTDDVAATMSPTRNQEEQLHDVLIDYNKMTHDQFFIRLTSLSTKYFTKKSVCIRCFNQYEYTHEQCTICPIKNTLIRPIPSDDPDFQGFQKKIAEKLRSEYVLTADNYIKMLLVYLRVQSGLPVLIMGETGCGKTALIQFLCQKILDDEMVVFRIHAGITSEKIIETMGEFSEKARRYSEKNNKKRIWVFLDEFNATPNIGLFKEMVCERTLLGKKLPKNMVLLGACNPQRRKRNKEESDDNIGIKKYHSDVQRQANAVNSSLIYSVVTIPETMLEHVWDYGYLDAATETKYVRAMLNTCVSLNTSHMWLDFIVKVIAASQKFYREREDVSSVSLRDVARFCRFYNWFYEYIIPLEERPVSVTHPINDIQRASLIALFLCYYFRLDSSAKRNEYMSTIAESVRNVKPDISLDFLNIFLQNEKMILVERMELPKGMAKNRALTDNIFVLFTCILNRIPVILCGKPGSSKTSAVQIIISSLRGKKSKNAFFRTLPELIAVSYQGSQNCTSESIGKVFARADKCIEANSKIEFLPVIVFDEIGLAELSPHNPLKVLHSELEIEKCRYGFVGLSNWRLDAAKMNRVLYLSCPDPDIDDLKMTALTLSKSMLSENVQAIPLDDWIIDGLAVSYMAMFERMNQHKHRYYFGLRDYYSLIKGIVRDMSLIDHEHRDLYEIIRHQLSINFDGTTDGAKFMWSKLCENTGRHHKIAEYSSPMFDQLINQSIKSRTGRFLMLIGENESAFDYVQRYINIKHSSLKTRTLIGSTFTGDFLSSTTYTELYNTRVLMDIILTAETDVILFLRRLGHLYVNLYDLFNQNFAVSARKKFCRIALGSLYHPRCVIHDNFFCVVFVRKQDLDKYDPPFLNRFEKHLIDMDTMIDERHKVVISILTNWINQLLSKKPNENFPLAKHLFIEFNNDYIVNLVTDAFDIFDNAGSDPKDVVEYCQNQLIRTSSFDLPILLSLIPQSDHLMHRYYQIHADLSFSSFINQILEQKEKMSKLLIYTYTQIYHVIDYNGIKNHTKWIQEVTLSSFQTELELIQKIKVHYQTEQSRLLFIRVDYHQEYEHIPMLKNIILNELHVDDSHGVCLIFHLQRNRLDQINSDVFFNGWSRLMIDDLQEHKLIPQNILVKSTYQDLIVDLKFLSLEKTFDELIDRSLISFHYTVSNKHFEGKINERRDRIIQQLTSQTVKSDNNHPSLRSIVKDQLLDIMKKMSHDSNQPQFKDWRQDLLTNELIIGSCRSFDNALSKTISFFVDNYLSLLLVHLEKYSMIDSYFFLINSSEEIYQKLHPIWFDCWTTTVQTIHLSIINQNNIEIPLVFDLHLPCATIEYEIIRQIRSTILHNQQTNEKKWIDFAWKQLISKSIYGDFMKIILDDSDLFSHYYYDQLTLARNEANIHHLSTSFLQHLLISKMPGTVKDRLTHLLIDYEELFEIMRVFEIAIQFIGEEDMIFEILNGQFAIQNNTEDKITRTRKDLYYLVMIEADFYLIPPTISITDKKIFQCNGDPFIETSLMNLIELLISPSVIDRINDIDQMITAYGLLIQSVIKLDRYEVTNLEKFRSCLRLACCMSALFPTDEALVIFKQVCRYSDSCSTFNTLDKIDNFVVYLDKVITSKQPTANATLIHQILIKFENELLRNYLIDNIDQCGDILKFISRHDHDLWKYSAKIFTLIDKRLDLSSTTAEHNGQILQRDDFEKIKQYFCQLNDPTRKIEILMATRIYIQLMLDENYEPRISEENNQCIIKMLSTNFDQFKKNLEMIEQKETDQNLELISLIAWIKYYIQHYVYTLKNDNREDEAMIKINDLLNRNDSAFFSTVKLFIIKQLCQIYDVSFRDLCRMFANRNVLWIHPMTAQSSEARHVLILPTPLFECRDEFMRINKILKSQPTIVQLQDFIKGFYRRHDSAYCFIIWFIHYYSRFCMSNMQPDAQFVRLIEVDFKEELITWFEPIGYKLLVSLCTNFNEKSYFRLKSSMSDKDIHHRLIVLNMIALLLSFKSVKTVSLLGFLLYDGNLTMPQNYTEHFQKFDSLISIAASNDSALLQMINIRTQIAEQTKKEHQDASKTCIFRCSLECSWIFCFVNGNKLDAQKQCPLCTKKNNIDQNEYGLVIHNPHIEMNTNETLQFISKYVQQHNQRDDIDNYNCASSQERNIMEKHNHLKQPITYHFMHFLTNSIFLFLNDLEFISSCSTTSNCAYFEEQIESDYALICQHLSNVDQCYIWLYKLINHMINETFVVNGYLNSPERVLQLEKLIEEKLIIPHIDSVISEIREYKSLYADFVDADNKHRILGNFVDELVQDDKKYPLLNFFNITNIHSFNFINDFHEKLQLVPDFRKTYPMTAFVLKRLSDYDNIQYLYPIIKLTNYLIQNFNHRIKRNDAMIKTISEYWKNDTDLQTMYKQFMDVWYKINLNKVYFDHREYKFQRTQSKFSFENNTNISMFLLNKSNDSESILLAACLQTFANLQNDIVNHFHSQTENNTNKDKAYRRVVPIQAIQKKHLLKFDTNAMRKLLVEKGSMINYTYGMSRDVIYDYEEIEWTLRNEISYLPLIDTETMRFFNYQCELYDENISLINDIRARFEQSLFNEQDRTDIKSFIDLLDINSILNLSGTTEYILTYLRTVNNKNIVKTLDIQTFINEYVPSKICMNNKFGQKRLSSIHLENIIDLYEVIEEYVFDKVLSNNIRDELCQKSLNNNNRMSIVNQFIDMILHDDNIADCFKDLICWISMFKRLLVRLLSSKVNINLNSPLHDYVKRSDMWKGNVSKDNIRTIVIDKDIHVKHAYIILKGLETKQEELSSNTKEAIPTQQQQNNKGVTQTASTTSRPMNSSPRNKESKSKNALR